MKKFLWTITFCILFQSVALNAAYAFSDVTTSFPYYDAIRDFSTKKIVSGYKDGSFQPLKHINRAEFIKMLMGALDGKTPAKPTSACFSDIAPSQWFAPYVCAAKDRSIVRGFTDGTFRPEQVLRVSEAFAMISNTFDLPVVEDKNSPWYEPYGKIMSDSGYIPTSLFSYGQALRRAEAMEMIWRAVRKDHGRSTTSYTKLHTQLCEPMGPLPLPGIDMEKVRNTWLSWNNDKRSQAGLTPYKLNIHLSKTATLWSEHAAEKGSIDHKRYGKKAYYDFWAIRDWFKEQGLTFKKIGGQEFVENIGWGVYTCNEYDCTQELIRGIESTFSFFYNEKGKKYRPHYESLMSDTYKEIGVGIDLDQKAKKYYLTVHYATSITSSPAPICEGLSE